MLTVRSDRPGRPPITLIVILCLMLSAILFTLVAGCGGGSEDEGSVEPEWVQSLIFFGRNMPEGGVVSEEQFDVFLSEVITEKFPAGMTVFDAYGQMERDDGSIEKQPTKVVLLVHEKNEENSGAVSSVIKEYRERFGSPQVMLNTLPVEAEFFQGAEVSKPTTREVEQFVEEAVENAEENGKEKALAEFTDQGGEFQRGELYVYAYDFSGNVLAHGGDPSLVGQDLIDYTDPNGVKVIRELIKLAEEGGGWLDYTWENPDTGEQQAKKGYVLKVDDTWFVGSGIYE